jgi:hypothetical protein
MVAEFGAPEMALYGSSKAALVLLTKSWAAEYGPDGVRVNAVGPGPTRTEGTAPMVRHWTSSPRRPRLVGPASRRRSPPPSPTWLATRRPAWPAYPDHPGTSKPGATKPGSETASAPGRLRRWTLGSPVLPDHLRRDSRFRAGGGRSPNEDRTGPGRSCPGTRLRRTRRRGLDERYLYGRLIAR